MTQNTKYTETIRRRIHRHLSQVGGSRGWITQTVRQELANFGRFRRIIGA